MDIMRISKALLFTILITFLFQYQTTEAVKNQVSQVTLNKILLAISGDWYNNSGDKILSIHHGYFNGCQVVAAFDFAGSIVNGGAVLRIK